MRFNSKLIIFNCLLFSAHALWAQTGLVTGPRTTTANPYPTYTPRPSSQSASRPQYYYNPSAGYNTNGYYPSSSSGYIPQGYNQNAPTQQTGITDPTNFITPPDALSLTQDPFADVNFNLCRMTGSSSSAVSQATSTLNQVTSILNKNKNSKSSSLNDKVNCDDDLGALVPGSCSELATEKEGILNYDAKKQDALIKRLIDQNVCKSNKLAQASTSLKCFKTQFDILNNRLKSMQKVFDDKMKDYHGYQTKLQAEIEKETQRAQTLSGKVDKDNGLPALAGKLEELYSKMNSSTQGQVNDNGIPASATSLTLLKSNVDYLSKLEKENTQNIVNAKVRHTQECFFSSSPTAQSKISNCSLNDPFDCIMADFVQRRTHELGNDASAKKKAETEANWFRDDIRKMVQEFNGARYSDVSALLNYYDARGYGQKYGLSWSLVKTEMTSCYNDSINAIKEAQKTPGTDIYNSNYAYEQIKQSLNTAADQIIHEYDGAIRSAYASLTGQELNQYFNTKNCSTTMVQTSTGSSSTALGYKSAADQYKCASDLNELVYSMINGTVPTNAAAGCSNGYIPGTNFSCTGIYPLGVKNSYGQDMFCKGIRDCIAMANKELTSSSSRIQAMDGNGTWYQYTSNDPRVQPTPLPGMKKFITDANSNIESKFSELAASFKSSVGSAKQQLDQLRADFEKAGIQFPSISDEEPEPFKCLGAPDSLCEVPSPFGKKLGAAAGLDPLDGHAFDEATNNVRDAQSKLKSDYSKAKSDISKFAQDCQDKLKQTALTQKQTLLNQKNSELQHSLSQCTSVADNAVSSLTSKYNFINSAFNQAFADNGCSSNISNPITTSSSLSKIGSDSCSSATMAEIQTCADLATQRDKCLSDYIDNYDVAKVSDKLQNISTPLDDLIKSFDAICNGDPSCYTTVSSARHDLEDKCKNLSDVELKYGASMDPRVKEKFEQMKPVEGSNSK